MLGGERTSPVAAQGEAFLAAGGGEAVLKTLTLRCYTNQIAVIRVQDEVLSEWRSCAPRYVCA